MNISRFNFNGDILNVVKGFVLLFRFNWQDTRAPQRFYKFDMLWRLSTSRSFRDSRKRGDGSYHMKWPQSWLAFNFYTRHFLYVHWLSPCGILLFFREQHYKIAFGLCYPTRGLSSVNWSLSSGVLVCNDWSSTCLKKLSLSSCFFNEPYLS